MLNYQTKRGCPFECNYCAYPLIEGRQFRMQDPGFVVQNIMEIKRKFDVHSVFFTDSVFNDSQNQYLEIAEELLRQKCEIKWAAYFRPSKIAPDELQLLKKSGLYAMEIGSDAACDTTLQGIGKSFHFESILALNEACVEAEIACAHFFMFGGPGETDQTIAESLKNIEKLNKCVVFGFSGIRILPGTGIQKIAIDEKIIDKDECLLKPCYYVSPLVEKQKMETDILLAFKKRKEWLFPPSEGEIRMRTLQLFGFKGLIWDMLINFSNTNFKKRNIRTA
ncbi:MAG: radical SAM protein [Desulfobacteraceae bacterium]|nr:radical SAM protein [Desulfobacteraceae bacterium]